MGLGQKGANYPALSAGILKQMLECVKLWLVLGNCGYSSNLAFYGRS